MTEKEISMTDEEYYLILFCIGYTMGEEYQTRTSPYDVEDYEKIKDKIIGKWVNSDEK